MRVDFESPNPVTRCFGGIAGANSAARGADGLAVLLGLQHAVHGLVAVEEHVRAAGNEQALQRVGVELFQRVELLEHGRDVHHHPVANEVHAVLLQAELTACSCITSQVHEEFLTSTATITIGSFVKLATLLICP